MDRPFICTASRQRSRDWQSHDRRSRRGVPSRTALALGQQSRRASPGDGRVPPRACPSTQGQARDARQRNHRVAAKRGAQRRARICWHRRRRCGTSRLHVTEECVQHREAMVLGADRGVSVLGQVTTDPPVRGAPGNRRPYRVPIGKPMDAPPYPTIMRAPHFYPDFHCLRSRPSGRLRCANALRDIPVVLAALERVT